MIRNTLFIVSRSLLFYASDLLFLYTYVASWLTSFKIVELWVFEVYT